MISASLSTVRERAAASRLAVAREALDDAQRALGVRALPQGEATERGVVRTGLRAIDDALRGGLAPGRLYTLIGARGSGRLSLALSWLGRAARTGSPVALIDGAGALDGASVSPSLRPRMLWVRAGEATAAMECAEQVLSAAGFAMVVIYLADSTLARGALWRSGAWARVQRGAESARSVVVAVCDEGDTRAPGSFAHAVLRASATHARWSDSALLIGVGASVSLTRSRGAAPASASLWRGAA